MAAPTPPADVVTRVSTLAAASARPTLSTDEVTASIKAWPRPDRFGVTADVDGWEPTYDLPAILSELWGIKAGKVAGDFTFNADGASYNKGDVMAHCLAMQASFASQVVGGAWTGREDISELEGVVVNG